MDQRASSWAIGDLVAWGEIPVADFAEVRHLLLTSRPTGGPVGFASAIVVAGARRVTLPLGGRPAAGRCCAVFESAVRSRGAIPVRRPTTPGALRAPLKM